MPSTAEVAVAERQAFEDGDFSHGPVRWVYESSPIMPLFC